MILSQNSIMLQEPKITALLPTTNPEQSKEFFKNTLGLKLVSEDPYGIEFEGLGSNLRISVVPKFTPHQFAVLGFKIEEINFQVKALTDNGVKFEKYKALNQNELGVWISPGKAKIAWFKDPDGNLLSLTQYP